MQDLLYSAWTQGDVSNIAGIANIAFMIGNIVISAVGVFGVVFGILRFVADIIYITAPNIVEGIRSAKQTVANTVKAVGDQGAASKATGLITGIISNLPDIKSISSFSKDQPTDMGLGTYLTTKAPKIALLIILCVCIFMGYATKIVGKFTEGTTFILDAALANLSPEEVARAITNNVGTYVIKSTDNAVKVGADAAARAVFTKFSDISSDNRQTVVGAIEDQVQKFRDELESAISKGETKYKFTSTAYVSKVNNASIEDYTKNAKDTFTAGTSKNASFQKQIDLKQIGDCDLTKYSKTFASDWGGKGFLVVTLAVSMTMSSEWTQPVTN